MASGMLAAARLPPGLSCRIVRSCRRHHNSQALSIRSDSSAAPATDDDKRVRVAQNQLAVFQNILADLAPHVTSPQLPAILREAVGQRKFNSSNRRLFRELAFTALRYWPWVQTLRQHLPPPAQATEASGAASADLRLGLACASLAGDTAEVRTLRRAFPALGWPASPGADALGDAQSDGLEVEAGASSDVDLARVAAMLQEATGVSLPPLEILSGPGWFASEAHWPAAAAAENVQCMLSRPPVWIRVQSDDVAAITREFSELGVSWVQSSVVPGAWRVAGAAGAADLTETASFSGGAIEVQDLGSQMILRTAGVAAGAQWLDACAGAGGKTLQLARLLGPKGRVDAVDVRPHALEQLRIRAKRAGLEGRVRTMVGDSSGPASASRDAGQGQYDGVLVDAPCTGSGTWRRSPHLRWQLTEEDVAAMAQTQVGILKAQAARVKPGGVLLYATCSLSNAENGAVVQSFLASAEGREFAPAALVETFGFGAPGAHAITVLPRMHNTDGFFVAQLRRRKKA